ncbi:MAG: phosphodiesterase [Alteromonadaceae bacterium]|nr:phosphodiesterase [Alteromonadaceae bacterium]
MGNPLFAKQKAAPAESVDDATEQKDTSPLKVLIIDDETEVHWVTDLTLKRFRFDGKKIQFLHAYSGKEAKEIFEKETDIALALVDVVMETDHAGLDVVHYVRKELNNTACRLVLRTGQPGQAPEHEVIERYDINDYKEKTELTSQKLKTLMYTGLRSYRDISTIESHRKGLRQVIESTTKMLQTHALNEFASAVLKEIMNLLQLDSSAIYCSTFPQSAEATKGRTVLAATGCLADIKESHQPEVPDEVESCFKEVLASKQSQHFPSGYVFYNCTDLGYENLLFIDTKGTLSDAQKEFLEIYCINVSLVYENLMITEEISETQKDIIHMLGNAVELRTKEVGAHVKRVAEISYKLAVMAGLSDDEAENIRRFAPVHNLGKVAIPDSILHKPGELTPEEWDIMKSHPKVGADMLSLSNKPMIKNAAKICYAHHEQWNGGGYPEGLKGEDIPVAARITALADAFDSMGSKRSYKEAWPKENIISEIEAQKGEQFDPQLAEILLANFDDFWALRARYPD